MLFYLTASVTSSVVAFLYPGYACYKTLSQRPASEEDLERWLMYWSVLGCVVGFEYVAEWLVSWIPMYYLLKTLFLLYLALPQTRGSSYIYINHLQPFLHVHESQIDATLASLKARLYAFVQERCRAIWDNLVGAIAIGQQQQQQQQQMPYAPGAAAPPSLGDPVSGPAQLVAGLWRSYGPTLLASGAMLLSQGAATSAGATADVAWRTPAGSQIHLDRAASTRDRPRRSRADGGSESEVRVRGGQFEEGSDGEGDERDAGPTSWFGWAPSGAREK